MMRAFRSLAWVLAKLALREPLAVFFTLLLPAGAGRAVRPRLRQRPDPLRNRAAAAWTTSCPRSRPGCSR
jgi:hypothetical protein